MNEFFAAVLAYLASVDRNTWIGVAGPAATVFAVMLTNLGTSRRLRKQLVADRTRDEDKRLFESRRDIYLAAADALATVSICLGHLSDLTRPASTILEPYYGKVGDLSKVYLIASQSTVDAVSAAQKKIVEQLLDLNDKRKEIENERDRINAIIASGNATTRGPAETQPEFLNDVLAFGDMCLEGHREIATLIDTALLAIRTDLLVDVDKPTFNPRFGELAAHGQTTYRHLVDRILTRSKLPLLRWPPMH